MSIEFIIDHLEYIVAIGGVPVIIWLITSTGFEGKKNDLTPFIVKLNKQKESMNKRSKSTLF